MPGVPILWNSMHEDSVWAWLWFEITMGPQNLTTACQKRLVNDNWLSNGRWHERERVSSGRVFFNQTFTSVLSTSWRPSRLCYCTISLVGVSHHRAKSVISVIQVLIYGESPLPHLKSSLHLIPYLATRLVPFQSESQFRYRSRDRYPAWVPLTGASQPKPETHIIIQWVYQ